MFPFCISFCLKVVSPVKVGCGVNSIIGVVGGSFFFFFFASLFVVVSLPVGQLIIFAVLVVDASCRDHIGFGCIFTRLCHISPRHP